MKQWWFEYGDIDNDYQFYYSEDQPENCYANLFGPFDTFGEAKAELILRFTFARDEINLQIKNIRTVRAKDYK